MIQEVADAERPAHFDTVIDRLRVGYEVGRVRARSRDNVRRVIDGMEQDGEIVIVERNDTEDFFIQSHETVTKSRSPAPGTDARGVRRVSQAELRLGVIETVESLFGCDREELISEVANQFGYQRVGSDVRECLEKAIQELLNEKQLTERQGMIERSVDPPKTAPSASDANDGSQGTGDSNDQATDVSVAADSDSGTAISVVRSSAAEESPEQERVLHLVSRTIRENPRAKKEQIREIVATELELDEEEQVDKRRELNHLIHRELERQWAQKTTTVPSAGINPRDVCPDCGTLNRRGAIVCKSCRRPF